MLTFIIWYAVLTIIGWISFPFVFRLLPALADRGYSISRVFGLLIWGYVFWLLASLGFIKNTVGGILVGLIILVILSGWALRSVSRNDIWSWLRENRLQVFIIEVLFLAAFAGWTVVRAANPEILGTEKPMELAFINSIIHSAEFPPHDPWLSGYAISYYYFGYVITAMIAKLTATQGSIAFNLAVSQTFALAAAAAYGIIYTLLSAVRDKSQQESPSSKSSNLILSLLGPTFLLLISNLEGFLEVLHARGIFWRQDNAGNFTSSFWSWLDLQELSQPPAIPLSWVPSRYLWWWRASRVVQDYDLAGAWREVIDEFPFFSYLLGDLHPHVLAMPFALLAVSFSLNLFLGGAKGKTRWLWINLAINPQTFWFAAVIIGGLAFLNTWDFPMYVFLFSIVFVISRNLIGLKNEESAADLTEVDGVDQPGSMQDNSIWSLLKEGVNIALPLTLSGVLLYLPFYIGFSSQAGGILPNLIYSTRGAHFWIMFGPLLLPIFSYLVYLNFQDRIRFTKGILLSAGLILALWVVSLGIGLGIANIPLLGNIFMSSMGGESSFLLITESLSRRVTGLAWVTILLLMGLTIGYLYRLIRSNHQAKSHDQKVENEDLTLAPVSKHAVKIKPNAHDFSVILLLIGGLLVVFVEFFYLRDQFGSRMNTIFKFYYQTWIFWGLSAAFGSAVLLRNLKGIWNLVFRIGFVFLLIAALSYPFLSLWQKTSGFNPQFGFTLDGTAYLERNDPDEMAAIRWLEDSPDGVVLEAVGPQYSEFARVATNSGQPNVLGWAGHESQWRGGRKEIGTREEDIEVIYVSNDWERTKLLLDMYNVRYIFIGNLERRTYRVNEAKFEQYLGEPVFTAGQVAVYEIPREIQPADLYRQFNLK